MNLKKLLIPKPGFELLPGLLNCKKHGEPLLVKKDGKDLCTECEPFDAKEYHYFRYPTFGERTITKYFNKLRSGNE